jgi:CheY-like chemotaxis protein
VPGGNQIKIIVSVEATGIGIKSGDMQYLFNDFTRLDLEHNHDIEGSGLGLTIARSFCEAMGGGITVASTYGKGSAFTATVIQTCENAQKIAQLEDPAKRVLVYEDRPAYLQSLLSAFDSLGVQPECAHDLPAFMHDIQGENFNYAFVSSRYAADCISCWEGSGSAIKLIVMLDSDDMSSPRQVGSVHLPIYSSILANILNGVAEMEKHMFHPDRIGFTAPSAHILVVDDLPTNLRVAEELMRPYGMEIDTCLSGSEALDLVQRNRYDVVFMDHMMPEMDGLLATDLIRKLGMDNGKNKYYRNLPIVMLTANAVAGQREMFLKNGINDFLPKPIDVRKLNMILATWIPLGKQQKESVLKDDVEDLSSESLPVILGVNVKTGIQNAGGSVASYVRILSMFCKDLEERFPKIRQAAAEGDFPSYTTMVHAIKGAARSIGAIELGELAAELEPAGRNRDSRIIAEKTDNLLQRLQELTEHIRSAIGEPEDETGEATGPGDDTADLGLDVLKDALNTLNTEGVDAFFSGIHGRQLSQETKGYINKIEQHVLLFEYDKAVEIIDKILSLSSPAAEGKAL